MTTPVQTLTYQTREGIRRTSFKVAGKFMQFSYCRTCSKRVWVGSFVYYMYRYQVQKGQITKKKIEMPFCSPECRQKKMNQYASKLVELQPQLCFD